jgi:hypothetical protein
LVVVFGPRQALTSNRAVTYSMAVRGRLPWREIIPYVIAQLAGAVLGGLLIVAAFGRGRWAWGVAGEGSSEEQREVRHRDRAKGEPGEDSSGEQGEVRYRVGLGK